MDNRRSPPGGRGAGSVSTQNSSVPRERRLSRGTVALRGSTWWNRFRAERIDPETGEVRVVRAQMRIGEFRSRAQAIAALEAYLALLDPKTATPGPCITFARAAAHFLELRVSVMRRSSQRSYRNILKLYLLPSLGPKRLTSIDAGALQALIVELHQRGLARATVEAARARACEVLLHARRCGFATCVIERSAVRLPSAQKPARPPRIFTSAEIEQILAACEGERRALFAVMAFSGVRIGECLALSWDAVDLETQTLHIRASASEGVVQPPKTHRSTRSLPMVPRLVQELTAYREQLQGVAGGLLFATRTGRPRRADDVRRRWLTPLLRTLGLPQAGAHAFRHFFARYLDELGAGSATVRDYLGHHDITTQSRYVNRGADDLRAQIEGALHRHEPNGQKP